jgi:hypothetical protein
MMTELKSLGIQSKSLNDEAINYLKHATQLESLNLRCPRISSQAIQSLKSALPRCEIVTDD